MFFSRFEYHTFYVLYPFVTYLLTLLVLYYIAEEHRLKVPENRVLTTIFEATRGGESKGRVEFIA
jgi:hypothetical protein